MFLSTREGLHPSTGHCSCLTYLWSKSLIFSRQTAWQTGKSPGSRSQPCAGVCSEWWGYRSTLLLFSPPGAVQNFIFLFSIFAIDGDWEVVRGKPLHPSSLTGWPGFSKDDQPWRNRGAESSLSWHGRWLDWSIRPFGQAVQTDPSLLTSLPLNSLLRPSRPAGPQDVPLVLEHVGILWNHHTHERQKEKHKGAGIPLFITLTSLETPSRLKEGPSLHPQNRCSCRKSLLSLASPA